jgi:AcrR family transcriptional regulator
VDAAAQADRQRLPADQRRELIIAAAERAFGDLGYAGVNVAMIAAAAGVTKPIVYRHFASKEELYLALFERHREELPGFVEELPADEPLERLVTAILRGWFAYAAEHGGRWRMLFRDSGGGPEIAAARARMYGEARRVLVGFLAARPEFEIDDADLEATAEVLRGGLSSLVLYGQENAGTDREQLVRAGTRIVAGLARVSAAGSS